MRKTLLALALIAGLSTSNAMGSESPNKPEETPEIIIVSLSDTCRGGSDANFQYRKFARKLSAQLRGEGRKVVIIGSTDAAKGKGVNLPTVRFYEC